MGHNALGILLPAAAVVTAAAAVVVPHLGREKFIRGEFDAPEQLAGIIRGGDALLAGDAEIVGGDEHLHVAHNLHDGEQPDGDIHRAGLRTGFKLAAKPPANAVGNPAAGVAAAAAAVAQPRGQGNRLCHLHRRLGQNAGHVLGIQILQFAIGAEHFDIALTAIQNHLFVENRDAVDGDGAARRGAEYIQAYVEEERHIHRIEALVKRHRLQIQIDRDDLRAAHTDIHRILHQTLPLPREIHPQVLQAVFIIRLALLEVVQ